MGKPASFSLIRRLLHGVLVAVMAVVLTAGFFLVLPVIQAISKPARADLTVTSVDAADAPPPPPPPPEEEPEPEPEPESEPPRLEDDQPLLDLAQLDLALGGSAGAGAGGTAIAIDLNALTRAGEEEEERFSLAGLEQRPRPVYQPGPALDAKLRRAGGGTVYVAFHVAENGRVENPVVLESSNSAFDRSALAAVSKWRFEPGKRNGKPVRFRMRVPITFPGN